MTFVHKALTNGGIVRKPPRSHRHKRTADQQWNEVQNLINQHCRLAGHSALGHAIEEYKRIAIAEAAQAVLDARASASGSDFLVQLMLEKLAGERPTDFDPEAYIAEMRKEGRKP